MNFQGCEIDGSKASRLKKTNVTDNLDDDVRVDIVCLDSTRGEIHHQVTRLYMENLEMNGNEETARRKPTAVLSFIGESQCHSGVSPMEWSGVKLGEKRDTRAVQWS